MALLSEKLRQIQDNFSQSLSTIIRQRNQKIKEVVARQDQEKIKNLLDKLK